MHSQSQNVIARERVGRYEILRKIATGGMAELFLAKQVGMEGFEKVVALKRILPNLAYDEEFIAMFRDEARIVAKLDHPNIVQMYDLGKSGETYYLAMEYIPGRNLASVAKKSKKRGRPLPPAYIARCMAQACEGLHYAHTRQDLDGRPLGIVHRDVSPQNIIVTFSGGVKLVDFGIAKARTKIQKTKAGVLKGKYAYMAPEQIRGEDVDARADLFAVGIVLYELLCGQRPFERDSSIQTLKAIVQDRHVDCHRLNPNLPDELVAIIDRCLEKDVHSRYQSAQDVQVELEDFTSAAGQRTNTVAIADWLRELFEDELKREVGGTVVFKGVGEVILPDASPEEGAESSGYEQFDTPAPDPIEVPASSGAREEMEEEPELPDASLANADRDLDDDRETRLASDDDIVRRAPSTRARAVDYDEGDLPAGAAVSRGGYEDRATVFAHEPGATDEVTNRGATAPVRAPTPELANVHADHDADRTSLDPYGEEELPHAGDVGPAEHDRATVFGHGAPAPSYDEDELPPEIAAAPARSGYDDGRTEFVDALPAGMELDFGDRTAKVSSDAPAPLFAEPEVTIIPVAEERSSSKTTPSEPVSAPRASNAPGPRGRGASAPAAKDESWQSWGEPTAAGSQPPPAPTLTGAAGQDFDDSTMGMSAEEIALGLAQLNRQPIGGQPVSFFDGQEETVGEAVRHRIAKAETKAQHPEFDAPTGIPAEISDDWQQAASRLRDEVRGRVGEDGDELPAAVDLKRNVDADSSTMAVSSKDYVQGGLEIPLHGAYDAEEKKARPAAAQSLGALRLKKVAATPVGGIREASSTTARRGEDTPVEEPPGAFDDPENVTIGVDGKTQAPTGDDEGGPIDEEEGTDSRDADAGPPREEPSELRLAFEGEPSHEELPLPERGEPERPAGPVVARAAPMPKVPVLGSSHVPPATMSLDELLRDPGAARGYSGFTQEPPPAAEAPDEGPARKATMIRGVPMTGSRRGASRSDDLDPPAPTPVPIPLPPPPGQKPKKDKPKAEPPPKPAPAPRPAPLAPPPPAPTAAKAGPGPGNRQIRERTRHGGPPPGPPPPAMAPPGALPGLPPGAMPRPPSAGMNSTTILAIAMGIVAVVAVLVVVYVRLGGPVLVIETKPPGATVYLDDRPAVIAPHEFGGLRPEQKYHIRVELAGFQPRTHVVELQKGNQKNKLIFELERQAGAVPSTESPRPP